MVSTSAGFSPLAARYLSRSAFEMTPGLPGACWPAAAACWVWRCCSEGGEDDGVGSDEAAAESEAASCCFDSSIDAAAARFEASPTAESGEPDCGCVAGVGRGGDSMGDGSAAPAACSKDVSEFIAGDLRWSGAGLAERSCEDSELRVQGARQPPSAAHDRPAAALAGSSGIGRALAVRRAVARARRPRTATLRTPPASVAPTHARRAAAARTAPQPVDSPESGNASEYCHAGGPRGGGKGGESRGFKKFLCEKKRTAALAVAISPRQAKNQLRTAITTFQIIAPTVVNKVINRAVRATHCGSISTRLPPA